MSVYQLKTFSDLVRSIRNELGIQSTDTTANNRIKEMINVIYAEIVSKKRWYWLNGSVDITLPAYITAGTASVLQNSNVVTLSVAPMSSKRGYYFAIDGYSEIYRIDYHDAASTTIRLSNNFTGGTNPTAGYRIWTDKVALPTDCKETVDVSHDFYRQPMENVGRQEFNRVKRLSPLNETKPLYYYTGDYADPTRFSSISALPSVLTRSSNLMVKTIIFDNSIPLSIANSINAGEPVKWNISGAGHPSYNGDVLLSTVSTTNVLNDTITYTGLMEYTESATADTSMTIQAIGQEQDYNRYRELFLYPALTSTPITLHVDYSREALPLNNDSDEPLIPFHDRIVLRFGALSILWSSIGRNPEESARNKALYEEKLNQMESKWQDALESAVLRPSKNYLGSKRNILRKRAIDLDNGPLITGGSPGGFTATGVADRAAIFGSDGVLVASPTVTSTELSYLDGATSNIQGQIDAFTNLSDGKIFIGDLFNKQSQVTPTGDVTISNLGVTSISNDVIVDAQINSSAAITRSKLASGNAYSILVNDASGVMSENASLTPDQVVVTDANGQLTTLPSLPGAINSVSLNDNEASPISALSWVVATYDTIILRYSLNRGGNNKETGSIYISTDGTNASIAQAGSNIGTLGVTFSVDINSGSLRLLYSTTSTGTAVTMKYIEEKWLA